jgi:hypothetical protein
MASNDQANDVATYAASVRAALSDLPSEQAEVLLEDIEDHLREIAAEAGGPLTERLGSPEQYAQELRTAYGAVPANTPRPDPALQDLRRAIAWVTASDWYRELRAFLPQLRPAWWVVRGYLAALILTAAFSQGYNLGPIPNPTTKHGLAEILATGVAIWLSVRIGRRSGGLPQGARFLAVSGNESQFESEPLASQAPTVTFPNVSNARLALKRRSRGPTGPACGRGELKDC